MRVTKAKRISVSMLLLVGLAGCTSIDFDYPRTASVALQDTDDTYIARQLRETVSAQKPGEAGFYLLSNGIDALAARLLLAEKAQRSIDLQYYLIKDDLVGNALLLELLNAADRGVRVRLLLDDIFTSGYDVGMAALHAHPNFEIRIFNPFNRGSAGRAVGALTNFGRINRRMHNKSFTVDNQITLIGGRNIADEYFGAREDAKFSDLDVLGIGPVVRDVSSMFDSYWNHETALPVPAFTKQLDDPAEALARLRSKLEQKVASVKTSKYAGAVKQSIGSHLNSADSRWVWAPYALVHDAPAKGIKKQAATAMSITTALIQSLQDSDKEVLILSPYFVPRKTGVEFIGTMIDRGIDVTIITNSLAANNQFSVHAGYAPSRKRLLQRGTKIYEVRPDAEVAGTEFINASGATTTLHTKAFVVDRKSAFIGSFNFDPRSANINTELGVIIHNPALAEAMVARVNAALASNTYEVFLNEKGKLRWRGEQQGHETVYEREPETTWGQRFAVSLVRLLPIRGQL